MEENKKETDYITMNGAEQDAEISAVDWSSVELENYEYFNGQQLLESMMSFCT